jgi:hypothetical protein
VRALGDEASDLADPADVLERAFERFSKSLM